MKKTTLFGKLFLGAAVVTMSLGAVSCKDKPKDTEEVAEEAAEETPAAEATTEENKEEA